jgi:hypothetical protein
MRIVSQCRGNRIRSATVWLPMPIDRFTLFSNKIDSFCVVYGFFRTLMTTKMIRSKFLFILYGLCVTTIIAFVVLDDTDLDIHTFALFRSIRLFSLSSSYRSFRLLYFYFYCCVLYYWQYNNYVLA